MRCRRMLSLACVVLAAGITCGSTLAVPVSAKSIYLEATGSAGQTVVARTFTSRLSWFTTASIRTTSSVVVTGSAMQGNVLSTSKGSWANRPPSYAYHWEDCNRFGRHCSLTRGATRSTYLLTSADVGHTIRSLVTATASTGSTSAESAPTAVVLPDLPPLLPPVDVASPTVSGTTQQGQTVSTSTGSWLDSPTSYAYQWQDCDGSGSSCSTISGATQSTYTLTSSDVGHTMRAVVTATNSAGSASATSAQTTVVSAPPRPSNSAPPAVAGQTTEGQSLSTTNGSWTNNPSSYSYQWQDCDTSGSSCSNIAGASQSTYTLTSGDVGHTLRSVVTAANAGGSAAASSAPTSVVAPLPPSNTAAPVVTGSTAPGQTLSTSNGSWTGNPTSYVYSWQDCNSSGGSCASISGATSNSYTLQASDVGSTIRSVVTATNSGGAASASSAATATVSGTAPANTTAPAITGQAAQGQTLSTSDGSWSGSATSYAYRWQDCNSSGGSCASISGATSNSYTLQASDVGSTIRSVVTATNSRGSASASSAATATVSGTAPPPTGGETCDLNATTSNFAYPDRCCKPGAGCLSGVG